MKTKYTQHVKFSNGMEVMFNTNSNLLVSSVIAGIGQFFKEAEPTRKPKMLKGLKQSYSSDLYDYQGDYIVRKSDDKIVDVIKRG